MQPLLLGLIVFFVVTILGVALLYVGDKFIYNLSTDIANVTTSTTTKKSIIPDKPILPTLTSTTPPSTTTPSPTTTNNQQNNLIQNPGFELFVNGPADDYGFINNLQAWKSINNTDAGWNRNLKYPNIKNTDGDFSMWIMEEKFVYQCIDSDYITNGTYKLNVKILNDTNNKILVNAPINCRIAFLGNAYKPSESEFDFTDITQSKFIARSDISINESDEYGVHSLSTTISNGNYSGNYLYVKIENSSTSFKLNIDTVELYRNDT